MSNETFETSIAITSDLIVFRKGEKITIESVIEKIAEYLVENSNGVDFIWRVEEEFAALKRQDYKITSYQNTNAFLKGKGQFTWLHILVEMIEKSGITELKIDPEEIVFTYWMKSMVEWILEEFRRLNSEKTGKMEKLKSETIIHIENTKERIKRVARSSMTRWRK